MMENEIKYDMGGSTSPRELKGYRVRIFTNNLFGSAKNIVSNGNDSAILVTDGKTGDSSTVMSNEPYLLLKKMEFRGRTSISAEPVNYGHENKWKMFGGAFVYSSDSRFSNDISQYPVPLHDRVEYKDGGGIDYSEFDKPSYMDAEDWEKISKRIEAKESAKHKHLGTHKQFTDWWYSGGEEIAMKKYGPDRITAWSEAYEDFKNDASYKNGGGIDVNTYDFNKLAGKYVDIYSMGVAAPSISQIKSAHLSSPNFRYRDLTLQFDLGNAIIPFENINEFLNNQVVFIKADKEDYAIQLIANQFAKGGNISEENQSKIAKLEKVVASTMVPEAVKEQAKAEIERLRSETSMGGEENNMKNNNSELNKEVYRIVNKINDKDSFEQIVSEVLTDSNYHSEAFKFASLLDKTIKTKEDWYKSDRFVADDENRKVALKISNLTHWDANYFGPALEFALKMKGFHRIAEALEKALSTDATNNYPNAIDEITKRQTEYAQDIANRTGLRQGAVAEFIAKNGLNEKETLNLLQGLGMKKLDPRDFMTAVTGVPNNEYETKIVEFAKSNEAFKTPEPLAKPTPKAISKGNLSSFARYISKRNIKSLVAEIDGQEYTFTNSDIVDGVYVLKENIKESKPSKKTTKNKDSLIVANDDFSFLLGLSDKELSKRLDLIRKQQVINGNQYLEAKNKGYDTSKIEESGMRLQNQENAIIQARLKVNTKTPKVTRTQFEEEEFEFGNGGGVKTDKYGFHLEPQFKVGDEITMHGFPGKITGVHKGMYGRYSYDVSFIDSKGFNRASNFVDNKANEIKVRGSKMAKGGGIDKNIQVKTTNQIIANDIMKYADLQNVEATQKKSGRNYIINLSSELEMRDSMTGELKKVLYPNKTTGWKHKK